MRSRVREQGSAHIVIIVLLVLALLSALGFIFWQNFLVPKDEKTSEQTSSQQEAKTKTESTATQVDKVAVAKTEISAAMNNDYKGLSGHMISPIAGAIANSDGIFSGKTSEELASLISNYFGASNPNLAVSGDWTFVDYKDLNNDKLTNQFKQSTFTDYATSYVGIAKVKDGEEVFVAYTLNADGLITYAFWGMVLGF